MTADVKPKNGKNTKATVVAIASGVGGMARREPPTSTQNKARNTVTQAISFDWELYNIMEAARFETRLPIPRSVYVREALEEKFRREGRMPPRNGNNGNGKAVG